MSIAMICPTADARPLDRDHLRRLAPSIFAEAAYDRMSARYKFVPTIEVVDLLADRGFYPVRAMQSRSRIEGKGDFTKHLIRFRHADHFGPLARVDDETPEVVLVNSHDGTAAYRFMAGIFRLVCSNGMIVQSADHGSISVRHSGGSDFNERVIDATYQIVEDAPRVMSQIEAWKGVALPAPQQGAFAEAAASLRGVKVEPRELLRGRRREDRPAEDGTRSLWATVNAVQENLIRGGVRGTGSTGKRTTTRAIKSVDADVRTNRALWLLAERMAQLAGA